MSNTDLKRLTVKGYADLIGKTRQAVNSQLLLKRLPDNVRSERFGSQHEIYISNDLYEKLSIEKLERDKNRALGSKNQKGRKKQVMV